MVADIKSLSRSELQAQFAAWDQPAYRVSQLLDWLYVRRATDWERMSNLPRTLRAQLRQHYSLRHLELVTRQGARDETQKFLWRLPDGALIESVLIPAAPALYGEPSDRHTLCVSTQVGCAYGCKFCASGLEGWKRHLRVEEIVEQVLATERLECGVRSSVNSECGVRSAEPGECGTRSAECGIPGMRNPESGIRNPEFESATRDSNQTDEAADVAIKNQKSKIKNAPPGECEVRSAECGIRTASRYIDNLVLMGMGEPLANYDNLLKALHLLNAPWGGRIGARKITISTSGLAPQIRRLAEEAPQYRLAISLHGATDEVRNRLMPINRKYPLRELVSACEYYLRQKGRMLSLEYILIAGVNDHLDQVAPLAELARRLQAKINLIPYNQVEGLAWERPTESAQEAFCAALKARKIPVTLRREKGHDIDAACGQLRLRTEKRTSEKPQTSTFKDL